MSLRDLVIKEQVVQNVRNELVVWLKERKPRSLQSSQDSTCVCPTPRDRPVVHLRESCPPVLESMNATADDQKDYKLVLKKFGKFFQV